MRKQLLQTVALFVPSLSNVGLLHPSIIYTHTYMFQYYLFVLRIHSKVNHRPKWNFHRDEKKKKTIIRSSFCMILSCNALPWFQVAFFLFSSFLLLLVIDWFERSFAVHPPFSFITSSSLFCLWLHKKNQIFQTNVSPISTRKMYEFNNNVKLVENDSLVIVGNVLL